MPQPKAARIALGLGMGLALAVAAGWGAQAQKAEPPRSKTEARDISGVWFGQGNLDPTNGFYKPIEGGERPFTPAGAAIFKQRQDAAAAGHPIRQPADECMPHGVPAILRVATPHQVIQTPGQVTILTEASRTVRIIYMDEPQAKDAAPTFMGHSVGKWDGDTLVIDTVAQRPNWLDPTGAPASDALHVTERWRKIENGRKLEVVATIDDPKMYTRPWDVRREYLWAPDDKVMEYVCEESDRIEPGAVRSNYK